MRQQNNNDVNVKCATPMAGRDRGSLDLITSSFLLFTTENPMTNKQMNADKQINSVHKPGNEHIAPLVIPTDRVIHMTHDYW